MLYNITPRKDEMPENHLISLTTASRIQEATAQ